jgi:hypothetical protein
MMKKRLGSESKRRPCNATQDEYALDKESESKIALDAERVKLQA